MLTLAAGAGFLAWRRSLPRMALVALVLVALAAWMLGPWRPLPLAAALLTLPVLAGAAWLVHRHLRVLQAAQVAAARAEASASGERAARERLENELQRAHAAAEAADESRARFLAAASHDLRQPAHALGLYLAALRAGPLAPAQAEIAERMQGSVAALDSLFAALMDVSRMDAGAVMPQWDTVALAPLLRRLADEWALPAEARGLRLSLHLSDPGATTVTDPLLLERVLRNLLANAVRYTARGGVLLACRLRGGAQPGAGAADATTLRHWRIEVWDTGCGIAPADQARVFDEFFQAAAAPAGAGLGLGLSIVQRLARLLQLQVGLRSVPGRGSVFWVDGLAPAGQGALAAVAERGRMRRLEGLGVAVLEDDAEVRDAMRRLLQLWGCRVVDADTADDLLSRWPLPARPDALVADLRLAQGRSGPAEVARLQAAWGTALPVLWVSAETAAGGLRRALPEGQPTLTKPVSPARLRAWLESLEGARPDTIPAENTGDGR